MIYGGMTNSLKDMNYKIALGGWGSYGEELDFTKGNTVYKLSYKENFKPSMLHWWIIANIYGELLYPKICITTQQFFKVISYLILSQTNMKQ